MKKNIGIVDFVIRLMISVLLIVLYVTNVLTGTIGIISLAVAGVLVLTSIFQYCPIWAVLRINTLKKTRRA